MLTELIQAATIIDSVVSERMKSMGIFWIS